MDGIHDMGGTQGWGAVPPRGDEPVFAARWHARVFALGVVVEGLTGTNIDAFRHAIERLHPLDQLADGYYGRWLGASELLCTDTGLVADGAVEARARRLRGEDVAEPARPDIHRPAYQPGGPGSLRHVDQPPRWHPGDVVRASARLVSGHTRMPRYVRGHTGKVVALRPAAVLPDSNAHFLGEAPEHVYTVAFDSTELWGDDAEAATVHLDLFESYLEVAP